MSYETAIMAVPSVRRVHVERFGEYEGVFVARIRLKGASEDIFAEGEFGSCSYTDEFESEMGDISTSDPDYNKRLTEVGRDVVERAVPFDEIFKDYLKSATSGKYFSSSDEAVFQWLKTVNPSRAKEIMKARRDALALAELDNEDDKRHIRAVMARYFSGEASVSLLGISIYKGLKNYLVPAHVVFDYIVDEDTLYWQVRVTTKVGVNPYHYETSRLTFADAVDAQKAVFSMVMGNDEIPTNEKARASTIFKDVSNGAELTVDGTTDTYSVGGYDYDTLMGEDLDAEVMKSLTEASTVDY